MSVMHAAVFQKFGDPVKNLKYENTEVPKPAKGQILVKMVMSPIHNHDLILIKGEYGYKPQLPAIGGSEAVGIIEKLGEGVSGFKPGDRVSIGGTEAAWADYFLANASDAVNVPEGLSDELAAQLMNMPVNAVLALDKLNAQRGDWVIINAANGAVGKVVAQVAAARGIHVASLVNRDSAVDDMAEIGVKNVFVTSQKDWQASVKQAIGNARVAGGIDMVSGKLAGEMLHFVSEGGMFLSFGAMSGQPVEIDPSDMIFKEITFKGFWGHKEVKRAEPATIKAIVTELVDLIKAGKLKLPAGEVFSLAHIDEAAAASSRERKGKILVKPA